MRKALEKVSGILLPKQIRIADRNQFQLLFMLDSVRGTPL